MGLKNNHNKKRNTLFIYETLIQEFTRCVIKENEERQKEILNIIKEHFKNNSILKSELDIYIELLETKNVTYDLAKDILLKAKKRYNNLDQKELFKEQSKLISKINKQLSNQIFKNFLPHYRIMATLYQVLNENKSLKDSILLEEKVIKLMSENNSNEEKLYSTDKLVMKSFINKFNETYKDNLLEEQQILLNKYIVSYTEENNIDFKIYLNEEIKRLRDKIQNSLDLKEIKEDELMLKKTQDTINIIDSYKKSEINDDMLVTIMKLQELVREIES